MFLRVFGVIGLALLIACATGANEDKAADGNAGKPAEPAEPAEPEPAHSRPS